jgi:hypothetical protein
MLLVRQNYRLTTTTQKIKTHPLIHKSDLHKSTNTKDSYHRMNAKSRIFLKTKLFHLATANTEKLHTNIDIG